MSTNTEELQLIDQLPNVIAIQTQLIKRWCDNNGWTDLHLSRDHKIYAFAPGSYMPSPLPKEAFIQQEKLAEIFVDLTEIQSFKEFSQKTLLLLPPMAISCAVMIGGREAIPELIEASNQREVVSTLFDYSIILLLMLLITTCTLTLSSLWKQRKLKYKLANKISTDFLASMKDIDKGAFIRMIDSSVTLTKNQ